MFDNWKISANQVHLVLRDNAANMAKAMREASLPSFGCFAHSLQLVVEDGVLSQQAVIDVLPHAEKSLITLSIHQLHTANYVPYKSA